MRNNKTDKQKKTSAQVTNDICQRVTDKLVALMESGVNPWRKPWNSGECAAVSHNTGAPYSLINQILLGFRGGEYLTFNQVKKEGGNVKKGAKGQQIIFWQPSGFKKVPEKPVEKTVTNAEGETGENEKEETFVFKGAILKAYTVFHIEDCEGIEAKHPYEVAKRDFNPDEEAERLAAEYCGRHGITLDIDRRDNAFYRPSDDSVHVPLREQFKNTEEFYSTLYHELGHSTGHESRLDRITKTYFGSEAYSREELVAEITAATCLAHLGIDTDGSDKNSAAYLKAWAQFLKSDPRAIVVAAGKAEKAFNMIVGMEAKAA